MEDAPPADNELARPRLNVEYQEATVDLNQARGRHDVRADGQRLQMIHLDARANTHRAGRQCRLNRLPAGAFHHPNHCRGRKDRGKMRVEVGPGPFRTDIRLVPPFQTGNQGTGL